MDDSVKQALLKDPQIQEAIKKAGKDALNDPQVQQMLVEEAKKRFPAMAADAQEQIKKWAADPKTQAQAKAWAAQGITYVAGSADRALQLIETGPAGVRVLAFIAATASIVNAAMTIINPFNALSLGPPLYLIAGYQVVFALTCMIFECPPAVIEKIPAVSPYQDMLCEKVHLMTEAAGRGGFYIFQGTLWLAFASWTDLLSLGVGIFLAFIGVLHVAIHYGKLSEFSDKMRSGYDRLGAPAASSS